MGLLRRLINSPLKNDKFSIVSDKVLMYIAGKEVLNVHTISLERKILDLEFDLKQERLSHKQLIATAVNQAVETERQRLGQELHDNISQILACANLYYSQVKAKDETDQEAKIKGNELMLIGISEIRKLSAELKNFLPEEKSKTVNSNTEQ